MGKIALYTTAEMRMRNRSVKPLRDAAIARGEKSYDPGIPCKYGHIARRITASNVCYECNSIRQKTLRENADFREKDNRRRAKHYADNKEYYAAYHREYAAKNPERRRENRKRWESINPEKVEQIQRRRRKTSERYKIMNRANASAHHKRCKQATPPWQTSDELRAMHILRPRGYAVDHIVPLRHKAICGLNVRQNLQYLPRSANSAKSNKWPQSESFDSSAIVPFSWEHFLVISEQA